MLKLKIFFCCTLSLIVLSSACLAQLHSSPLTAEDLNTYKQWCAYLKEARDENFQVPPQAKQRFLNDHNLSDSRLMIISEKIAFVLFKTPIQFSEPPNPEEIALIEADRQGLERAILSD
jgi:hypothetical protein